MSLGRRSLLTLVAGAGVAATVSIPAAQAATTTTTRIRLMSANFRLTPESDADIAAGHAWARRKAATLSLLKSLAPSVICGQECSTTIRNDLAAGLGANWRNVRNGNVIVWYDTAQHNLISSQLFSLPSPPADPGTSFDPRRLVLAQLRMKATGAVWWAASSHFTGNTPDQAEWQAKQMRAAVKFITDHGDIHNAILGTDMNNGETDSDSPRGIARASGLFDLRSKLAALKITNGSSNSFNGWQPPPHNGRWVDDLFTGDNLMPYYGKVADTNGASDHQFIVASSIKLT